MSSSISPLPFQGWTNGEPEGSTLGALRHSSVLLSSFATLFLLFLFLVFQRDLLHWFVLPVALCGVIAGVDLMKWATGDADLFDPAGLMGLLGYHFFFIAPLLMITWQYRMPYMPEQPEDYRAWLGMMAILNCGGLLLYRWMIQRMEERGSGQPRQLRSGRVWKIHRRRFWILLPAALVASCVMEGYIFASYGGIRGYMDTYSQWLAGGDEFQGSALWFAVAESSPVLLAIGLAVWNGGRRRSWTTIAMALLVLLGIDILVGGLRGSRSNVVWTMFWIAGITHFTVRRLPRTIGWVALCGLYAFISIYASYKQNGSQLLDRFAVSEDYAYLSDSAEGPATVLVGDFSRCDVQASLLYRQSAGMGPGYAMGASYIGALAMMIPKQLWEQRPPTVVRWTTDAEFGSGAFDGGVAKSSRVYGIAGEAMLNFGAAGVLVAYIVLGLLVARLRSWIGQLRRYDMRLLLAPFLINALLLLLLDDSDNAVFYLVKYGLVPVTVVLLSSTNIEPRGSRPWRLNTR